MTKYELQEYVQARLENMKGAVVAKKHRKLMGLLCEMACELCPSAVYHTPIAVESMIVTIFIDYAGDEADTKELPPEPHIQRFSLKALELEAGMLQAGHEITHGDRARALWGRFLDRVRG